MEDQRNTQQSRRNFLTKTVPACALTCAFGKDIFGMIPGLTPQEKPEFKHKFDKKMELKNPLSIRRYFTLLQRNFIRFCKHLVEEFGEKEALEIIRNYTEKRLTAVGKAGAIRNGDNSFSSYINIFRQPFMLDSLNMEIIEDTETAFEIRITECLSHEIFRDMNFDGEFGYTCVCHGDYAWAEGYNPKIKLIRDKTLMQGHSCCNHRYILET